MDLHFALKWFEITSMEDLDLIKLKKIYRRLTLKYHPDKGGKTADFVQLQEVYSYLQDCIKYPHTHKTDQKTYTQNSNNTNSQANDTSDIEFYKQRIKDLQKYNSTYQNFVNLQIQTIKQFYKNLDQINSQNNSYNSSLGKLLNDELAKLDKRYKSGWWKSIVGIKSIDKSDLVYYQNQLVNEYNRILTKSQKDNLQINYNAYQEILDQIVQGINAL